MDQLKDFLKPVMQWIEDYLDRYAPWKVAVSELNFPRLPEYFSQRILDNSYAVQVDKIEVPPLNELGLEGFSFFESGNYSGITFMDTYFYRRERALDEALHFHELVHTLQWDEMGPENFLLVYGLNLLEHGYRISPLEKIAYDLEERFKTGDALPELEEHVRQHARDLREETLSRQML